MKYIKKLTTIALISALGLLGCNKSNLENKVKEPFQRAINGITYQQEGNKLTQLTEDEDNRVSFGVLSDPHSEYNKVKVFVEEFKKRNVDGIVISGDLAQHFRDNNSDYQEIKSVLEEAAKSGLPVYFIPGNHDLKKDYQKAVADLSQKYKNLVDMSKIRIFDGDDADIVSCPLMDDNFSVVYGQGFVGDCSDLGSLVKQTNDKIIVVSHHPPKGKGTGGIDYVPNIKRNVGDKRLAADMKAYNIGVGVFGHIHEAGGKATTFDGKVISTGEYSNELLLNPGPASYWPIMLITGKPTQGMAGILTVKGNQAKYEIITLD